MSEDKWNFSINKKKWELVTKVGVGPESWKGGMWRDARGVD